MSGKLRATSMRIDLCPACKRAHTPNTHLWPIRADVPEGDDPVVSHKTGGEEFYYFCHVGETRRVLVDIDRPELYQRGTMEPARRAYHATQPESSPRDADTKGNE